MAEKGQNYEQVAEDLIGKYKEIFDAPPDWAFPSEDWDYNAHTLAKPFPPTIPFIGKNYFSQKTKIALYASSENLAHYERKPETIPEFLCDDRVWNRHRAANIEGWDQFFPRVHIGPVENGSLLCACLYLCEKLGIATADNPKDFLETLVVANVGKYSKAGKKVKDYAGNIDFLKPSLPYIAVDLGALKPDILILPKAKFKHQPIREIINKSVLKAKVVLVPQFNSTVVNIHLKRNDLQAIEMREGMKGTLLDNWTNQLKGYKYGYPYRYFVEIGKMVV